MNRLFHFDKIQFIIPFKVSAVSVLLKNSFPVPRSFRYLPMFRSERFAVLILDFMSTVQLTQPRLLKRSLFPPMSRSNALHMNWVTMCVCVCVL